MEGFLADYREKTSFNRKILDHLLHDAFSDDEQTGAEADLVLDPDPQPELIEAVLSKYHFRDVKQAYKNLMALSEEKIRFLSTRRCRHFLAAIAAPVAGGSGRHRRSRRGPGESRQGQRLAGRQGRALGTLQLQPAQPAAVCRVVCVQPALPRASSPATPACSTA